LHKKKEDEKDQMVQYFCEIRDSDTMVFGKLNVRL